MIKGKSTTGTPLGTKIDKYLKSRWYGKTDWEFFFKNPKFNIEDYFVQKGIDMNKPIVGLATNMLWDAQVYFPTNFFSGMLEWLFFTIDFFIENPQLQLVIRIHPAEAHPSKKSVQRVENDINKKVATYVYFTQGVRINNIGKIVKISEQGIIPPVSDNSQSLSLLDVGVLKVYLGHYNNSIKEMVMSEIDYTDKKNTLKN